MAHISLAISLSISQIYFAKLRLFKDPSAPGSMFIIHNFVVEPHFKYPNYPFNSLWHLFFLMHSAVDPAADFHLEQGLKDVFTGENVVTIGHG